MQIEIAWFAPDGAGNIVELDFQQGVSALSVLQDWQVTIDWKQEFVNKNINVWGENIDVNYICQAGDRITWVRPLLQDPKVARKNRLLANRN